MINYIAKLKFLKHYLTKLIELSLIIFILTHFNFAFASKTNDMESLDKLIDEIFKFFLLKFCLIKICVHFTFDIVQLIVQMMKHFTF